MGDRRAVGAKLGYNCYYKAGFDLILVLTQLIQEDHEYCAA